MSIDVIRSRTKINKTLCNFRKACTSNPQWDISGPSSGRRHLDATSRAPFHLASGPTMRCPNWEPNFRIREKLGIWNVIFRIFCKNCFSYSFWNIIPTCILLNTTNNKKCATLEIYIIFFSNCRWKPR